ncbi:hypothetical protein BP5796_00403 [Coleophoma crateriformis]|uniref:Uncharacterized protein n=1 Tax=Coleophoma crateriformis TaxID=565419 RepID=A0A3D8T7Y3_9HELO|nr:hypothetical protein BP5796_00403 [Coleophoma crateriformis]
MPNYSQHQSLRSAFLASRSPTQLTDIATASLLPLLCDTYLDAVFYCLQSLLYSGLCAPLQLPSNHHIFLDKAQLAPSRTMETSILSHVANGPGSKPNNALPVSGNQASSRSENQLISHRKKFIVSSSNNQDVEFYQTPLSDAHGSLPDGYQQPNQGSSASSSSSSSGDSGDSGFSSAADGVGAAPAAGGAGTGGDEDGEDKRAMSSSEDDDDDDDDEEEDDDDDEDSDEDLAIEMNLGLGVLEHLSPASGITEANAPEPSSSNSNSGKEKRKPTEGSEEVINVRPLEKKPRFVMPPASSIASRLPGFLDALRVANEELARNPEKFAMGEEIVEERDEEMKEKKVEGDEAEGKGEEGQKTTLIEEL